MARYMARVFSCAYKALIAYQTAGARFPAHSLRLRLPVSAAIVSRELGRADVQIHEIHAVAASTTHETCNSAPPPRCTATGSCSRKRRAAARMMEDSTVGERVGGRDRLRAHESTSTGDAALRVHDQQRCR